MTRLTRRAAFGALAAPFVVSATASRAATIDGPADEAQAPGFARFTLGAMKVTVVSDGNLVTPASMLGANAPREEVNAFLEARFLSTETNYAHTNHVVIETGGATVLVDVGSGARFQPSAGRLLSNLEAAGIDPASITHVALTHAHPDHIWGMMDDFGDEPVFPAERYAIGAAEFDWWMKPGRVDETPDEMQPFVVGAVNALEPMAERLTMVADGQEVAPGVRMIASPGHTFGHMCVVAESGGESLLVLGDAINHAHVSFERPDWVFGFDADGAQAVETRKRLLDIAAMDRMAVSAYHLPFPGLGHVARIGDGYRFVPATMRWNG